MSTSRNEGSSNERVDIGKENVEELVMEDKCEVLNSTDEVNECFVKSGEEINDKQFDCSHSDNGKQDTVVDIGGNPDGVIDVDKEIGGENKGIKETEEVFRSNMKKESGLDDNIHKNSRSFAGVTGNNFMVFYKKLKEIPTELDENGNEFVVFDEILVAEGSKKWEKTLCGYFVGYRMSVNELRYNLRRMWGRHGFKDIVDYNNGIYFMKFHSETGLDFIVNNGPWMVKNKPLIVQQWDINMSLDKREPEKIPLWIKLCNVPLEA
ncbi:zinc knuckle CX2CX4HX4C containing protein [Tanacetum coccineum]